MFKTAVTVLPECAEETLAAVNMPIEQLDWYIPHQANIRIIKARANVWSFPMEKPW